jgi:3-hydroxyisobutyrate dehydrogenase and related beta-hydroxyacid dehydrogenases
MSKHLHEGMSMMKIGFIGTGVMGTGVINNLLRHGNEVTVYNRTKEHAAAVLANGASWAETPAAATVGNEIVFHDGGLPNRRGTSLLRTRWYSSGGNEGSNPSGHDDQQSEFGEKAGSGSRPGG